jgi:predicted Rossmann-fold nucleotide-binding protein
LKNYIFSLKSKLNLSISKLTLTPSRTDLIKSLKEGGSNGSGEPIIIHADIAHKTEEWVENARQQYEQALAANQWIDLLRFFRVAIFGSARLRAGDLNFQFVSNLAKELVEARPIDVVTGGGPGIMEAANEGLERAQQTRSDNGDTCMAKNHGVLVELPHEQDGNKHLHLTTKHLNFSTRLQDFASRIRGAYLSHGGYGTLLEKLFLLQLKQVGHIEKNFPIVAHPCWRKIIDNINDTLYHQRLDKEETPLISEKDLELITFSEDIDQIVGIFTQEFDLWKKNIRDRVQYVCS